MILIVMLLLTIAVLVGYGFGIDEGERRAEQRATKPDLSDLLLRLDAQVAPGHDLRVTAETWLDVIRPEIVRLGGRSSHDQA